MTRAVRGGRLAALVAGCGLAAAAACTDVSTDPGAVVSIAQDTTVVVSVIAGDTLRDTTGLPFDLRRLGRAYNGGGAALATPGLQVFVSSNDTLVRTPIGTVVRGAGPDSAFYLVAAPIVATTGTPAVSVSLQYSRALRIQHRFEIVPRPTVIRPDSVTPVSFTYATGTATSLTATVGVRLSNDTLGTRLPVRSTLVRFDLVAFSGGGIDSVRFVEPAGRDSLRPARIDTTDDAGLATRTLTVFRRPVGTAGRGLTPDTIALTATVLAGRPGPRLTLPLVVTVVDSAHTSATTTSERVPTAPRP